MGYVFTGAVFQSDAAEATGWKLTTGALDMYDASHRNTVHLDGASNLVTGRVRTGSSGLIVDIDPGFDLNGSGGFTAHGSGIRFTDLADVSASSPFIAGELQDSAGHDVSGVDLSSGWRDAGTGSASMTLLQTPGTSGVAQVTAWRDATDATSRHAMLSLVAPNTGDVVARLYSDDMVNITALRLTANARTALTGSSTVITALSQSGNTINWTTASLTTELGFVTGITGAQSHSVTLPTADQYQDLVSRLDDMDDAITGINTQVDDIDTQLGNNPAPAPMGMDWTSPTIKQSPKAPANGEWSGYYLYQSAVDASRQQYWRVLSNSGRFKVQVKVEVKADNDNNAGSNISIDFTTTPRLDGNTNNTTVAGTTHKMVQIYNNPVAGGEHGSTDIANPVTLTLTPNTVYYVAVSAQTMSPGSAGMINNFIPTVTVTPL